MAASGPSEPPAAMALPEPLQQALTAWPSPELEAQLAGADLGSLAAGLQQQELAWEAALFSQMLYRHKNQHRNTLSFRHLLEVRRGLQQLLGLRLPELLQAFAGLFRLRHLSQQDSKVASGEAGVLLLRRLLAACRLAEAAVAAIRKAASLTSAHLARLHFVRMHMLFLAMLARMQVLVCGLLLRCVRCYNELAGLVGLLPFLGTSQQQTGGELPEMLRCDWAGGRPAVALLPFPPGEGLAQRAAQHGLRFEPPAPPASLQQRALAEAEAAIQAAVPQKRAAGAAVQGQAKRQPRQRPGSGAHGSEGSRPRTAKALPQQRLQQQASRTPSPSLARPDAAPPKRATASPPPEQAGGAQPAAPPLQPLAEEPLQQPEMQPARPAESIGEQRLEPAAAQPATQSRAAQPVQPFDLQPAGPPAKAAAVRLSEPAAAHPAMQAAGVGAVQPAVRSAQQPAAQPAKPAAAVQREGRGFASVPLLGVGKRPGVKTGRFGSVAIAGAALPVAAGSRPAPAAGAAPAQSWAPAALQQPPAEPARDTGAAPAGAAGIGLASAAAEASKGAGLVPGGSVPAAAAAKLGQASASTAAEQPEAASSGAGKRAAGAPLLLPPAGKKRKSKGKGKAAQPHPAEAAPEKQPSWLDLNPW